MGRALTAGRYVRWALMAPQATRAEPGPGTLYGERARPGRQHMYFVNRRREQWRRMQSRWARVGWSRTLVVPLALVAWAVLAAGGQPSASASAPGAPDVAVTDVAVTSVVAAPAD
ncbi:MAG: hypothetical protein ACLP7F_16135, partial [Acidimicrobiales bacterium]